MLIARWSRPACRSAFAALAALAPALGIDAARAEFQAALYGGFSESFDSDISLNQPNGTKLTRDLCWSKAARVTFMGRGDREHFIANCIADHTPPLTAKRYRKRR